MQTATPTGTVVSVDMPASMNAWLRGLVESLVTQNDDGTYVLRHDANFWTAFFHKLNVDGLDSDLAFEQLQAVIDDWNVEMSSETVATPVP